MKFIIFLHRVTELSKKFKLNQNVLKTHSTNLDFSNCSINSSLPIFSNWLLVRTIFVNSKRKVDYENKTKNDDGSKRCLLFLYHTTKKAEATIKRQENRLLRKTVDLKGWL